MPSSPRPAFGQVWRWEHGDPMMLIHQQAPGSRDWKVLWMISGGRSAVMTTMAGLDENPDKILAGWELLSKENE